MLILGIPLVPTCNYHKEGLGVTRSNQNPHYIMEQRYQFTPHLRNLTSLQYEAQCWGIV